MAYGRAGEIAVEFGESSDSMAFYVPSNNTDVNDPDIQVDGYSVSGRIGRSGWSSQGNLGVSIAIHDISVSDSKYGITLTQTGPSSIDEFRFEGIASNDIYGAALRIGQNQAGATVGLTEIQRVQADGEQDPLTSYDTSNTDFLVTGENSLPIYLRDIEARNFSDAMIDAKSVVYISNATFESASRILRAHEGATIYISNSILNLDEGRSLAWLYDQSSRIYYYNTLWNGSPTPDPEMIEPNLKKITAEEAYSQVVELTSDPVLDLDTPFFANAITGITAEFSTDGTSWAEVEIAGLVTGPHGLVGSLNFTIDKPSEDGFLRFHYSYADKDAASFLFEYLSVADSLREAEAANEGGSDPFETIWLDLYDVTPTGGTVNQGSGNWQGQKDNDVIVGDQRSQVIHGNGGQDTLYGGGGDDYLFGDERGDRLNGGSGADTLRGGTGADTFDIFFRQGDGDRIEDYSRQGLDVINLFVSDASDVGNVQITEEAPGEFTISLNGKSIHVEAVGAEAVDWNVLSYLDYL